MGIRTVTVGGRREVKPPCLYPTEAWQVVSEPRRLLDKPRGAGAVARAEDVSVRLARLGGDGAAKFVEQART